MASLLQQLENNEVILLMYLADELQLEDKAEVEQKLAGDAGMRAELSEMRTAHAAYAGVMARLDATTRLPTPETVAVRQASRLVRQWATERLARPPAKPQPKGLPLPWWCYPVASAASVLIGFLVWWGNHSELVVPSDQVATVNHDRPPVPATEPSPALAELNDEQKKDLLDVFARNPADDAQQPLNEAVASLQGGDELDANFLGNGTMGNGTPGGGAVGDVQGIR